MKKQNEGLNMRENPNYADFDALITINDAAKIASLHRSTLWRCGRRAEIEIVKISPRRVGIRKSELRRWLASRVAA
jgi:predicted DNA-binding transcriptional regulator AlpA